MNRDQKYMTDYIQLEDLLEKLHSNGWSYDDLDDMTTEILDELYDGEDTLDFDFDED